MTAREVVELIKKNAATPWNERSTRDTFKAGNPDVTVKGIATTMMIDLRHAEARQCRGPEHGDHARGHLLERS